MLGRIVRKRVSPPKAKADMAQAPRGGRHLGGGIRWNADFQGVEVSEWSRSKRVANANDGGLMQILCFFSRSLRIWMIYVM
jgi:hypothetical protein